jgi:hypothetical protein
MFWCDLDVFRDLGFPQTAQRIRDELMRVRNADNYLSWAFDHGFSISKNANSTFLTDKGNFNTRWTIGRSDYPYYSPDGKNCWLGPTAREALSKAILDMAKWNDHQDNDGQIAHIDVPTWVIKPEA